MLNQRIDLSYDFQASFDLYLGKNANGADGMAFVLQNDPLGAKALGGDGGNYGAVGIKNGLGIAFDTFQNANLGDMAGDHTNFFKTGGPLAASRISDQLPIGNGNVADGNWHNVVTHNLVRAEPGDVVPERLIDFGLLNNQILRETRCQIATQEGALPFGFQIREIVSVEKEPEDDFGLKTAAYSFKVASIVSGPSPSIPRLRVAGYRFRIKATKSSSGSTHDPE